MHGFQKTGMASGNKRKIASDKTLPYLVDLYSRFISRLLKIHQMLKHLDQWSLFWKESHIKMKWE